MMACSAGSSRTLALSEGAGIVTIEAVSGGGAGVGAGGGVGTGVKVRVGERVKVGRGVGEITGDPLLIAGNVEDKLGVITGATTCPGAYLGAYPGAYPRDTQAMSRISTRR